MTIAQTFFATSGAQLLVVDSADFDGTNDWMSRGAALTGIADSKSGILSTWVRMDGGDGASNLILNAVSGGVTVSFERRSDNAFGINGDNTAGTEILLLVSSTTYTAGATWRHILASWDLAAAAGHLYINDVSDLASSTLTDDTVEYTTYTDWGIGASSAGLIKLNGCLAEFYFAPGQYLNFSIVANRRKFISSSGKPVFLGTDGAVPTGTAPIIYQHLDNGEAVANFATNRGTGGNFSITGTLETGSTSPSD